MSSRPYPLRTRPILMPKVWGGDRLRAFGKPVPPGQAIGESWEVADLSSTSAGGAGGGAQRTIIDNGSLAGQTLGAAIAQWGTAFLGRPANGPDFPLLVKFLDARENLSVQVHPSPAYARAHPGANLKTECWYILGSEPGSVIYKGVKPGVTRASFAAHIADGSVVDDMVAVPAVVGECHNLPSGTCHALGAGVLVAEVQTPSDTTYRVFDWGRTGRELHIEPSLACIEWGPAPAGVAMRNPQGGVGAVLRTEFFEVWHANLGPEAEHEVTGEGCVVVMALRGSGTLNHGQGDFPPMDLRAGQTVVVPAALAPGAAVMAPEDGRLECLLARVPIN